MLHTPRGVFKGPCARLSIRDLACSKFKLEQKRQQDLNFKRSRVKPKADGPNRHEIEASPAPTTSSNHGPICPYCLPRMLGGRLRPVPGRTRGVGRLRDEGRPRGHRGQVEPRAQVLRSPRALRLDHLCKSLLIRLDFVCFSILTVYLLSYCCTLGVTCFVATATCGNNLAVSTDNEIC